jgi:hypothetical protein
MERKPSRVGAQVLAGVLTVVSSALGIGEWMLLRILVRRFLWLAQVSPWAWRWWESVSLIVLGLLWLVSVYLVAYYYQQAAMRGRLGHLFAYVTLGQVSVPLLLLGVLQIVALLQDSG